MASVIKSLCSRESIARISSILTSHLARSSLFNFLATKSIDQSKQALPPDSKCDMIGPADPVTNLRPMKFYIPDSESSAETAFRLKRMEVQQWNLEFWIKHNSNFVKERKEFVSANQKDPENPLTAEEMSVFYKSFLDKNWKTHLTYNWEWYKRNALLVLLHLRVKLHRLSRSHPQLANKH